MRKRQDRIGVWLIISIILAVVIAYLFFNKTNISIGNIVENTDPKPTALVYLSSVKDSQKVISHNIVSGEESTFLDSGFGELLSLVPNIDRGVAIVLIKKDKKINLMTLGLTNGAQTQLADLTDLNPKAAYEFYSDHYFLVSGDHSDQLVFLNESLGKTNEIKLSGEVTAVYPVSKDELRFAVFNGSSSEIQSYSPGDEVKTIDKVDGRVYQFNDSKLLYAKKITTDIDDSNPVGKTFWKITVKDLKANTDTIVSEGNFDQNAIADDNYNYIAYQKKLDITDQADGRIFMINSDNLNDRIGSGIPLIYAY